MLACDGVCVRVGVRRGEEVVTPNLAPVGSKNKNVGTPRSTLLSACPPNSGSNSFACVPGSNRRPRRVFSTLGIKFAENSPCVPGSNRRPRRNKNHSFFRPRFLSHFAGSTTTGKTTSRNASFPRKLPVTVSRSERASTALHAARSFHRRAPASRHRAYRRRTRDRCVPPGERRPRRRAPAERRAARASRPDRDHSERRIVLSRLERTGRAAA